MKPKAEAIALVTGSTGALGQAFCGLLAARGLEVVATGRDEAALSRLASQLPGVRTIVCDLTIADEVERLLVALPCVDFLVAVAGATEAAAFEQRAWRSVEDEIWLNAVTVTRLIHAYGASMLRAGGGQIITVASTAAGRPAPYLAAYAASKAFMITLSRALAIEWRNRGVFVSCCIPGPLKSDFAKRAGLGNKAVGLDPDAVAEATLRASASGHTIVLPGLSSWLRWSVYTLLPSRLLELLITTIQRKRIS